MRFWRDDFHTSYPMRHVWIIAGLLTLASVGYAQQYTMDLTGIGDGVVADGVYVSPYQGTVSLNGQQIYSGYLICDDFLDDAALYSPWTATSTNAGSLNGTQLFTASKTSYTVQQDYDAVAYLANMLVMPGNVTNATAQTNISFAIWDIMDGASTDPDGGAAALIAQAFAAVKAGYVGSNVIVFTPTPNGGPGHAPSQEFLEVDPPSVTAPEASTPVLLAADMFGFLLLVGILRKRARASQS